MSDGMTGVCDGMTCVRVCCLTCVSLCVCVCDGMTCVCVLSDSMTGVCCLMLTCVRVCVCFLML